MAFIAESVPRFQSGESHILQNCGQFESATSVIENTRERHNPKAEAVPSFPALVPV